MFMKRQFQQAFAGLEKDGIGKHTIGILMKCERMSFDITNEENFPSSAPKSRVFQRMSSIADCGSQLRVAW
jgi:hypothetical protein